MQNEILYLRTHCIPHRNEDIKSESDFKMSWSILYDHIWCLPCGLIRENTPYIGSNNGYVSMFTWEDVMSLMFAHCGITNLISKRADNNWLKLGVANVLFQSLDTFLCWAHNSFVDSYTSYQQKSISGNSLFNFHIVSCFMTLCLQGLACPLFDTYTWKKVANGKMLLTHIQSRSVVFLCHL